MAMARKKRSDTISDFKPTPVGSSEVVKSRALRGAAARTETVISGEDDIGPATHARRRADGQ